MTVSSKTTPVIPAPPRPGTGAAGAIAYLGGLVAIALAYRIPRSVPIIIGFDHNITHELLRPENQDRIRPIIERAERGEIEFYATQELIEEAWSVVHTNDPGRLQWFAALLGRITRGRHLRTAEAVVQSELLGKTQVFAPEDERDKAERHMWLVYKGLGGGPSDAQAIADEARRKRDDALQRWTADAKLAKAKLLALGKQDRRRLMACPFDEWEEHEWNAHGWKTAEKQAREAGVTNPDKLADRVMAEPGSFPFTRRYVAVPSLLKWWYLAKARAVHEGDQNDARQLTLVPALDHFLTRDGPLAEWSRVLGDPPGKVQTFAEFFQ